MNKTIFRLEKYKIKGKAVFIAWGNLPPTVTYGNLIQIGNRRGPKDAIQRIKARLFWKKKLMQKFKKNLLRMEHNKKLQPKKENPFNID